MKSNFANALNGTTVVQGVIAVLVVGGYVYLIATGQTVPDGLNNLLLLVVGFFFGTTTGYQTGQNAARAEVEKASK